MQTGHRPERKLQVTNGRCMMWSVTAKPIWIKIGLDIVRDLE